MTESISKTEPGIRDNTGRWQKGASGNPNGRARVDPEVLERMRRLAPAALEALCQCLSSADERVRLDAAKHLLDRVLGKPVQSTELTIDSSARDAVIEKLEKFRDEQLSESATQALP